MEGKSSFAYAAAMLFCTALWHTPVVPVRAQLADADWPMFQHDERHTGQSASNGPSTGTVRIKWARKFSAIVRTSPAIGVDGTIYIGVGNAPICALNPNGAVKWCTNEPGYVVTPLMSSPAVDRAGRIYMGERGNDTWAVAPDGDVLWRFSIPYDGDTLSSPAIDPVNGRIYTACGCVGNGTLYALDPAGVEQWHFKVGDSVHGSSPAIGPDGTVYIISGPGRLHALTPGAQGASRKWPAVQIGSNTKYGSPAIGDDGTIYAPSESGIKAIDPDDGHQLWAFATQGGVNTTPGIAASDGTILFGTTAGCFYALHPDGSQKWQACGLGGQFLSGTAIGANGLSYSATTDGWVYAFHPANGAIVWQHKIGKVQWSSPAIGAGNALIIGSQDHKLYVLAEE
jgi:outer membrane protein assembly factor BamB